MVRGIDASKWSAGKAYLVIEGHEVGDFKTYAYRTADFGRTWKLIVTGVPEHPNSFTRSIQEDPVRQGLLYMGTENRIYISFNDGDNWQPLINNMPPTPIYDLKIQPHFNDLVVGTYGRGYWIMDDVTPLQQLTRAGGVVGRAPVQAARRVPVPAEDAADDDAERHDRRREPGLRRVDQLLVRQRAARQRDHSHRRTQPGRSCGRCRERAIAASTA